jgi:hypothetical protein
VPHSFGSSHHGRVASSASWPCAIQAAGLATCHQQNRILDILEPRSRSARERSRLPRSMHKESSTECVRIRAYGATGVESRYYRLHRMGPCRGAGGFLSGSDALHSRLKVASRVVRWEGLDGGIASLAFVVRRATLHSLASSASMRSPASDTRGTSARRATDSSVYAWLVFRSILGIVLSHVLTRTSGSYERSKSCPYYRVIPWPFFLILVALSTVHPLWLTDRVRGARQGGGGVGDGTFALAGYGPPPDPVPCDM